MAQIYGELIRAQLQSSATNLSSAAPGLIYLNSGDKKPTVYDGTSWQKLVNEAALADLSALPIITLAKGGLGADASAWSGLVRIESGVASAGQIGLNDIPDEEITYPKLNLLDGDIPQAKVADLATDLGSKVDANTAIVAATKTKITYDAKGLVTAGADLVSADIPATLLSKVVSSTPAMTGALTLPVGTTADRTGLSTQGMVRYNTTLSTFEGHNGTDWGAIGGGGGGTIDTITQASHGFVVGDVLYLNGATYTKAIASAANTAEVVGVVSSVLSSSQFQLTLSGEISGLSGLTAGEVYFLSPTTAGLLTVTEPSTIGQVSVPVGIASSTTSLYVAPKRGIVVGGVNARTEVALTSGATTNVQSVAGMTAGELEGWVFISSASPVRFYVSAKFSLSGSGGDYNLNYQTTGDNPPASFLIDITTTGMIRVTLPAASGSTSVINYALNAPAIGASLPLTVSARSVIGDTSGTAAPVGYVGQIIQSTASSSTNLSSNAWTTITSITLSQGIWLVNGSGKFARSTAVQNFANIAIAIGTTVADISSNYTSKYEFRSAAQIATEGNTINATTINFSEFGAAVQPFYVRSDGTNLYFGDGTTIGITQNLTLAMYCLTFTGGPATAKGKIEAVRIA